MKEVIYETYDAAVIGAGHAGCEAALACARLGLKTIIFTISNDSIALMPCNPNVGGSSKGHLVREIDALGGEMGKNIDKTFIQTKMLNVSKGPAVHSLRAQADKQEYSREMRRVLEHTDHLSLRQGEIVDLLTEEEMAEIRKAHGEDVLTENQEAAGNKETDKTISKIGGVRLYSEGIYPCQTVIICTGTYLKARCITGDVSTYTGPNGLMAATHLSDSLRKLGIELVRFKTGTPARVDGRTVDFSKMTEQKGDETIVPFSFTNTPEELERPQESCWLTYTNEKTHEIIRENLDRSPLYSGVIKGTGPRYCPSIEDKVVRFAEKDRHQVFLEPEGNYTNEMYADGLSSSMPEDVQYAMYRTIPGMEHVKIVRNAYAIEYDCINPNQLKPSLEFKAVEGLFSGGQFNGSSGYEEAAAQGLIAGINAARFVQKKPPVLLDRSQAYIGVLIDDLVTKENHEPYRMMTSRAEYRLCLRQDNADERLTPIGHEIGLISEERYRRFLEKMQLIREETERLSSVVIGTGETNQTILESLDSSRLTTAATLAELICRPELSYEKLAPLDPGRKTLPADVIEEININLKYSGYIMRQQQQVAQFKKLESRRIPEDLDYRKVHNLRIEAIQHLEKIRPVSVGQASRIAGVSPSDISMLLIYLQGKEKHETE